MAVKDGKVIVWGQGRKGVTEVPLAARSSVTQVAGGWFHALAITKDVSQPTISIRCRVEFRDHRRWIDCDGTSAGLRAGTAVRPVMRLSENGPWTRLDKRHTAFITADGEFSWSVQVPDRRRAWIRFETGSTRSDVAEVLINYGA